MFREAVEDPDVLAIKQPSTAPARIAGVDGLLIEAAGRGKEVMAVVELKARFDEEANINWAERPEAAGAQVVYGIVGPRPRQAAAADVREGSSRAHYAHLTGNYNPKTARLYTDLGYLTADPDMTADVDSVFQQLASAGQVPAAGAPVGGALARMHRRMPQHLDQVAPPRRGYRRAWSSRSTR